MQTVTLPQSSANEAPLLSTMTLARIFPGPVLAERSGAHLTSALTLLRLVTLSPSAPQPPGGQDAACPEGLLSPPAGSLVAAGTRASPPGLPGPSPCSTQLPTLASAQAPAPSPSSWKACGGPGPRGSLWSLQTLTLKQKLIFNVVRTWVSEV